VLLLAFSNIFMPMWRPCRPSPGSGRPDESPAGGTVWEDGVYCPNALGQGCKDPKPLRLVRKCLVVHKDWQHQAPLSWLLGRNCVVHHQTQRTKQGTKYLLVSIDSYGCAHNLRKGLWFLTLVFNCSFVSYCSDSPLCIIVITTYSDIEPPLSRSASLTSRLRNAPYLLASCHTFCLNPRQSFQGLCRVQVIIAYYA